MVNMPQYNVIVNFDALMFAVLHPRQPGVTFQLLYRAMLVNSCQLQILRFFAHL